MSKIPCVMRISGVPDRIGKVWTEKELREWGDEVHGVWFDEEEKALCCYVEQSREEDVSLYYIRGHPKFLKWLREGAERDMEKASRDERPNTCATCKHWEEGIDPLGRGCRLKYGTCGCIEFASLCGKSLPYGHITHKGFICELWESKPESEPLFDQARSAYAAKKKKEEQASIEHQAKCRNLDRQWTRYFLKHPLIPIKLGAWITTDGAVRYRGRRFRVGRVCKWGLDLLTPEEAIARDPELKGITQIWQLWGTCPKCGEETWSKDFMDLAGLGEQLEDFTPSHEHRGLGICYDELKGG